MSVKKKCFFLELRERLNYVAMLKNVFTRITEKKLDCEIAVFSDKRIPSNDRQYMNTTKPDAMIRITLFCI